MTGYELIEKIYKKEIQNCKVNVCKENKYITTLEVKENIMRNKNFYAGMLASSKYDFVCTGLDYLGGQVAKAFYEFDRGFKTMMEALKGE